MVRRWCGSIELPVAGDSSVAGCRCRDSTHCRAKARPTNSANSRSSCFMVWISCAQKDGPASHWAIVYSELGNGAVLPPVDLGLRQRLNTNHVPAGAVTKRMPGSRLFQAWLLRCIGTGLLVVDPAFPCGVGVAKTEAGQFGDPLPGDALIAKFGDLRRPLVHTGGGA